MTRLRDAATCYLTGIRASPAQTAAFAMALWLFPQGPVGLIISHDFSMHPMSSRSIDLFGFVPVTVNGWHAMFHLITGVVGLVLVRTRRGAIGYAALIAAIYIPVGLIGLDSGVSVCGMLAVDTFGSWVHIIEGASMLALLVVGAVFTHRAGNSRRSPTAQQTPAEPLARSGHAVDQQPRQ